VSPTIKTHPRTRSYGNVQVATGADHAFNRDSVALRVTFRFGTRVTDTDRVVVVGVGN
jgi:hypothetical protein